MSGIIELTNKYLIAKKSTYESLRLEGKIPDTVLCFIEETNEFFTQGGCYGRGDLSDFIKNDDARLSDKRVNPKAIQFKGLVESTYDGSSSVTITLPKSLPASDVSDWAKQPTKPKYTPSEVGAAPAIHSHDDKMNTETGTEGAGNAVTSIVYKEGKLVAIKDATYLVVGDLETYAGLDSPKFTGTPTTPDHLISKGGKNVANADSVKKFVEDKNYITKNSNITGEAATAKKLTTAVNINLDGEVIGTTKFDGSKDVTIATKVNRKNLLGTNLDTNKTQGSFIIKKGTTITGGPTDWKTTEISDLEVVQLSPTEFRQTLRQGTKTWTRVFNGTSWGTWDTGVTSDSEYLESKFVTLDTDQKITGKKEFGQLSATEVSTGVIKNEGDLKLEQSGKLLFNGGTHHITNDGAYYSGKANSAGTAEKAVSDVDGNKIKDYYINNEHAFYLGTTKIPIGAGSGSIKSLNLNISGSAGSATKATQDSKGNTIHTTYAKKTDSFFIGTTEVKLNQGTGTITELEGVTIKGIVEGVASESKKWSVPMKLTLEGAVTGNVSFDGSKDVTVQLAVNHNHDKEYLKLTGGTISGSLAITNQLTLSDKSVQGGVRSNYGTTSSWRLYHANKTESAADVELASTGDQIYARQYSNNFVGVVNEVVLLDKDGNSKFNKVTATQFIGDVTGKATSAGSATKDGSGNVITTTYAKKGQTFYLGNTQIAINRAAGNIALKGVSIDGSSASCTGNAATVTDGVYSKANNNFTGTNTFNAVTHFKSSINVTKINLPNSSISDTSSALTLTKGADKLVLDSSGIKYNTHNVYHEGNANLPTIDWNMSKALAQTLEVKGKSDMKDVLSIESKSSNNLLNLYNTNATTSAPMIRFSTLKDASEYELGRIGFDTDRSFVVKSYTGNTSLMTVSSGGDVTATRFIGELKGKADLASKAEALSKKVTVALTGSVTGTVSTDLSTKVTITTKTNHKHPTSEITGLKDFVNSEIDNAFVSPTFSGTPLTSDVTNESEVSQIANVKYVKQKIAELVDNAPGTLDTLGKIAEALSGDDNVVVTLTDLINTKISIDGSSTITGSLKMANAPLNNWLTYGGSFGANQLQWRIGSKTITNNKGEVELAVAGTSGEAPIMIRRYTNAFEKSTYDITLMDNKGNSKFNKVTASEFIGQASSAIKDSKGNNIHEYYTTKTEFNNYVNDGWSYL